MEVAWVQSELTSKRFFSGIFGSSYWLITPSASILNPVTRSFTHLGHNIMRKANGVITIDKKTEQAISSQYKAHTPTEFHCGFYVIQREPFIGSL